MRYVLPLLLLAAALPAQTLEVIAAYYGADRNFVDVTANVRGQAQADGLTLTVGADSLGGDPFPGQLKSLRIYFRLSGQFQNGEWKDAEVVRLGRVTLQSQRGISRERGGGRGGVTMPQPLQVTRATYGTGGRTLDVTELLKGQIQNNQLAFDVPGSQLGDPAPGSVKELVVTYVWEGRTLEARARDGERLTLPLAASPAPAPPPAPIATGLKIITAQYGQGNRVADVTGLLIARIAANRLVTSVDNKSMGGDPAVAADTTLNVTYEWNGQRYTASAKEGQTLRLPPDNLLVSSPAPPATPATPADGVCFYREANYQGAPICATLGQDQARVAGPFASVRLFGRARTLDLFESANYSGRTLRLTSDSPDLSQVSSGFFATSSAWAPNLGSFRLGQ